MPRTLWPLHNCLCALTQTSKYSTSWPNGLRLQVDLFQRFSAEPICLPSHSMIINDVPLKQLVSLRMLKHFALNKYISKSSYTLFVFCFFLQHLSSVIGAILRRKLCRFHLGRDSHRCVWLCWISSRPIAESPIHASSFAGGCEHYINIPGAFFERKAYNSGEDRYCAAGA